MWYLIGLLLLSDLLSLSYAHTHTHTPVLWCIISQAFSCQASRIMCGGVQ